MGKKSTTQKTPERAFVTVKLKDRMTTVPDVLDGKVGELTVNEYLDGLSEGALVEQVITLGKKFKDFKDFKDFFATHIDWIHELRCRIPSRGTACKINQIDEDGNSKLLSWSEFCKETFGVSARWVSKLMANYQGMLAQPDIDPVEAETGVGEEEKKETPLAEAVQGGTTFSSSLDEAKIPASSLQFVPVSKKLATELVVKNHYLHRKPIISNWETNRSKRRRGVDSRGRIKVVVGDKKSKKALCWGIERDGQIVGVCTFGAPMWSVSAGVTGGALWDVKLGLGRWFDCLELTRLWVDDSETEHCIESKFVAWCLREVKKINPNAFIVSYADSAAGHVGTIYQALGFTYTGLSIPWTDKTAGGKDHRSVSKKMQGEKIGNRRSWAGVNVERKKRSRKHRYVKFLNPKDEPLLAWKRLPYPKQAA